MESLVILGSCVAALIVVVSWPRLLNYAYRHGYGARPAFVRKLRETQDLEEQARFHEDRVRAWLRKTNTAGIEVVGQGKRAAQRYIIWDTGVSLDIHLVEGNFRYSLPNLKKRAELCEDLISHAHSFNSVTPLSRAQIDQNEKIGQLSLVTTQLHPEDRTNATK